MLVPASLLNFQSLIFPLLLRFIYHSVPSESQKHEEPSLLHAPHSPAPLSSSRPSQWWSRPFLGLRIVEPWLLYTLISAAAGLSLGLAPTSCFDFLIDLPNCLSLPIHSITLVAAGYLSSCLKVLAISPSLIKLSRDSIAWHSGMLSPPQLL